MSVNIGLWRWPPNGAILERLEWLTDLSVSYNGNEQRRCLRSNPRRFFEHDILLANQSRRDAENFIFSSQGEPFAIPVWFDGERLQAPIAAGATSISLTTDYRDYHADGLAAIIGQDGSFEVVEISSIAGNTIETSEPVDNDWPADSSMIYPARVVMAASELRLSRFTGDSSYGRVSFRCVDNSSFDAASESSYRSFPVLNIKPEWSEDPTFEFVRKIANLDGAVGRITFDDESNLPIFVQSHRWPMDGRQAISAFRSWLYARKGRLSAFWLPTWSSDLIVKSNITSGGTTIDIEMQGYSSQVSQSIGRRDIRIELVSGQIYYRRITNCVEIDQETERITIDSAIGVSIQASNVRSVSFMSLARLDADAVELQWWKHDFAEASFMIRSFTNDL